MRASSLLLGALLLACGDDPATVTATGSTSASVAPPLASPAPSGGSDGAPSTTPSSKVTGTVPAPTPPREPEPDVDFTTVTTSFAGVPRSYIVGRPRGADPNVRLPLVMAFHGNPSNKETLRIQAPFERASKRGAYLVYPDAIDNNWDLYTPTEQNRDMGFVRALVAEIGKTANIDAARVYGFGFSGGAFFITQLACRFGGLFRAISVNSGGGPDEGESGYARRADGCYVCPGGPIATLVVHGSSDPQVASPSGGYTARCFSETNGCAETQSAIAPDPCRQYEGCPTGKPVKWCLVPGMGHQPWEKTFAESWTFFAAAR